MNIILCQSVYMNIPGQVNDEDIIKIKQQFFEFTLFYSDSYVNNT